MFEVESLIKLKNAKHLFSLYRFNFDVFFIINCISLTALKYRKPLKETKKNKIKFTL